MLHSTRWLKKDFNCFARGISWLFGKQIELTTWKWVTLGAVAVRIKMHTTSKVGWSSTHTHRLSRGLKSRRFPRACCSLTRDTMMILNRSIHTSMVLRQLSALMAYFFSTRQVSLMRSRRTQYSEGSNRHRDWVLLCPLFSSVLTWWYRFLVEKSFGSVFLHPFREECTWLHYRTFVVRRIPKSIQALFPTEHSECDICHL